MNLVSTIDEAGTQLLGADQAHELAARFVGGLRSRAVEPGSRIVFQSPNTAALLAAVLGCLRGGYIPVIISDKLTERERGELTADVDPVAFLDHSALQHSFDSPTTSIDEWWTCRPMHFTSGTSGRPKGVWSGWLDREQSASLTVEETAAWGLTDSDRHLVVAPLSHSAPLRFPLMTLMAGGSVLVPRSFDPALVSRLIDDKLVDTAFMAPAHLQRLVDTAPPRAAAMRLVAHAGSACPEHVRRAARDTFGDEALREFYGSTEGQFTICTPSEFDRKPGTVGKARPGRTLHIDTDGRIWCHVPDYARFSYWGDDVKTQEAWNADAFTVGDLGYLDEDEYLFLNGRRSDLIITGGVNVYPAEIERVVLDLPDIAQAIAFPVDDPRWGQKVCLAVVGTATEQQIREHCERELAPYKRPKDICFTAELPHTHSGKVDRLQIPKYLGLT